MQYCVNLRKRLSRWFRSSHVAIHGDPHRDPRKHIIALFYLVGVDPEAVPRGGDDA